MQSRCRHLSHAQTHSGSFTALMLFKRATTKER